MSKRIVLFNHKGGVSKTTSVYNLSWMLSRNHRVLVVDADPQCNLSSLILGDDFERYYFDDDTKEQNIKDGVKVAFEGKPSPIQEIECKNLERAPNLFLLAGHANLSEYEAALTFAQTSSSAIATLQNLPGAFAELIRLTEDKYNIEYTIIDLNPSLSSINQNFFIISNGFIVPTNPDPFSIMALNTLVHILPKWHEWKISMLPYFKDAAYPLPDNNPYFLGTIIQRFNIRRGKAAEPYRNNIDEIKDITKNKLHQSLKDSSMMLSIEKYEEANISQDNGFCLQEISDFQSLLPRSYDAGVPVFDLTNEELNATGPVLAQLLEKRVVFNELFENFAEQIRKISEILRATIPPKEYYFELEIVKKLKFIAFQEPNRIADGLSFIWNEPHKWKIIADTMGLDLSTVKTTLKTISLRRNQIVHEADIDMSTGNKYSIGRGETENVANFILNCGRAIYNKVKI